MAGGIKWYGDPIQKELQVIAVGRVSACIGIIKDKVKGKLSSQRRAPAAIIEKSVSSQNVTRKGTVQRVISTAPLANAWEYGGVLRPRGKTGKGKRGASVLAIPLQWPGPPRDKPFMTKAEKSAKRVVVVGNKAFLVDRQTDEFTHVLKERVRMSPHPFMRPGFDAAEPKARKILEAPINW